MFLSSHFNHMINFIILFLDVDDCAPNPCQHDGQCVDDVANFICHCAPGWAGDTCKESKRNCFDHNARMKYAVI